MKRLVLSCTTLAATLVASPASADSSINFFGDTGYVAERDPQLTNSFQATTLDIFATATEGKFTFVGEMVVEAFGSNTFDIDADRLEIDYKPRPWLRLRIGRMRTAFGYYSDAYQNGKFFFTPIDQPTMYVGRGIDGIVPSHSIGIHADAVRELGGNDGKVSLDAEVLNGRGADLDEVTAYADDNNSKAVNFRLRYLGEDALDGLIVGTNVYIDDIPLDADDDAASAHAAMHELIVAGHLVYVTDRVHFVSEAAWFRHTEHVTGKIYDTHAAFAELGYTLADVTPYARYEYTRFVTPDPYFTSAGVAATNVHRLSVGTKYLASASVAVKLEAGVDLVTRDETAAFQAAFAF